MIEGSPVSQVSVVPGAAFDGQCTTNWASYQCVRGLEIQYAEEYDRVVYWSMHFLVVYWTLQSNAKVFPNPVVD
ncbi:hypothetical protein VNO77_24010 [Canavalia gladiata]|uniref:Uncharacterized protein n=1 Tax=Canavalia gladiata TaxID=3824 RepID=A0AAN9L5F1_CANGL